MKTYYLFGNDAVKAYENGLDNLLDCEYAIHKHDSEKDLTGASLLANFGGWGDYTEITETEYEELSKLSELPENYWDFIEKHYPNYYSCELVHMSNRLQVYLEGGEDDLEIKNPRIKLQLINQQLYKKANEYKNNQ